MSRENVIIPPEAVQLGSLTAVNNFLSPENRGVIEGTAWLVRSGKEDAFFIPAVRFLVDATLRVVTLPDVEAQLEREVFARQAVASKVAQEFADLAAKSRLFLNVYNGIPILGSLNIPDPKFLGLINPKYLGTLGGAPFFDARLVGGGALRVLREHGITEGHGDAIVASRGLLAIAGVYKGFAERSTDYLGLPYVDDVHLRLEEGEEPRVDFTDPAKDFLRSLRPAGRGCPAGGIVVKDAPKTSLLENYWERIVRFLVPPDATAEPNS
ncbi:MAG TPA: hypothetical protein VLG37_03005 [Candidatus Saccharimonadales bacterium]|nr:hypothetical protein [Candidatus Saccharimonadales bacterium]